MPRWAISSTDASFRAHRDGQCRLAEGVAPELLETVCIVGATQGTEAVDITRIGTDQIGLAIARLGASMHVARFWFLFGAADGCDANEEPPELADPEHEPIEYRGHSSVKGEAGEARLLPIWSEIHWLTPRSPSRPAARQSVRTLSRVTRLPAGSPSARTTSPSPT